MSTNAAPSPAGSSALATALFDQVDRHALLDRVTDRWAPWFSAMEALGEDTRIRWGKIGLDGVLLESGLVPHGAHDGIGLFVKLLREHEGFTGEMPKLRQTPPPARRRLDVALRVLRAPDRASLPWKHFDLRPSSALPAAFAYTVLSQDETRALIAPRGRAKAMLSCRVLHALHSAVVPDLAGASDRNVWLVPVNMRGAVKTADELANQISFLPIGLRDGASALDIQQTMRDMLRADLHWGTWDAMGLRALLGRHFVRAFTRHLYRGLVRRGGTGWLGSFSFGGVVAAQGVTPKFAWYGVPPTSLMWPISAGSFAWGGQMSLALQVHDSLGKNASWAAGAVEEWKRRALEHANNE